MQLKLVTMEQLPIKLHINDKLSIKNPDSTELGRKIIEHSILLINTLGFEKFTFKKLSLTIESPESSIYRYFKNKHMLLLYLVNWYWSWLDYKIILKIANIKQPKEQLKRAINILSSPVLKDNSFEYVNEIALNKIIIEESVKVFHTKQIDIENKNGMFDAYKRIINRMSGIILAINSNYKYPHTLVSTIIEGNLQQQYYKNHLPSLVDKSNSLTEFYTNLALKTITCG